MTDLTKVFDFIKSRGGNGKREDFVSSFGESIFEEMCLSGMIRQGVNGEGLKTWKTTTQYQHELDFYREPTKAEKRKGQFLHSLGL